MKILIYDFEVFKFDWMVVIIDYHTNDRTIIINNEDKLLDFYNNNIESVWVGYNSRMYDQYIMKGILLGRDPYEISCKLIVDDMKGYQILPTANTIQLYNFDIATGFHSLKQLEGFMGSKIKESDVDFNIDRRLTQDEINEVELYCIHDVEETLKVFDVRKEEFDSQLALIEAFDLPMDMFTKTKAQLSAYILGATTRKERNDEFQLIFPDTLKLDKYVSVLNWYKVKNNLDYNSKLCTDISGVPHIFAWGGIHGAVSNYYGEGLYVMSDIASMYPALMIEYDCVSRNVENKEKYREIRDERLRLKKLKDKRQAPMKIVLNGTFGASKDKYNNLFDPRNANIVCVSGQLLLLDLIEKVEEFGILIQSNTDGILFKIENEENMKKYLDACDEWSKRTRLDLEHDEYVKVIQKDVNNYIIVDAKGKYKSKGAYVKELNKIDYDLPIINEAIINYFTKGISIADTINNCDELIKFQKIVKITKLFKYAIHGENIIKEKILRVFASNDELANPVYKVKVEGKFEKISYTPPKCFINNESVVDEKVPSNLDKQYYIDMATDRMHKFLTNDKNEAKPKSDIKGVNAIVKSEIEDFLMSDESDSILDFIINIKENTSINKSQFNTMCKLNFFSTYGRPKKILKCYEIYNVISSRKTFKFSELDSFGISESDMEKCYISKSDTKYTSFDSEQLLTLLFEKIDDESTSLKERLSYELQYYEKLKFTNSKFPSDVYCVQEMTIFKDATKPKFKLYSLKDGKVVDTRVINSEVYIEAPIKQGFLIKAKFSKKQKGKMVNGRWETSGEYETILQSYDVY